MDIVKSYSLKLFVFIFLCIIFLLILVDSTFYFLIKGIIGKISTIESMEVFFLEHKEVSDQILMLQDYFILYFLLISGTIFVISGLIFWLLLRFSIVKFISLMDTLSSSKQQGSLKDTSNDGKSQYDTHLFLYLLSVFQRDGRLLDFLFEDLSLYEDEQIGSAVRNIHEECRKVIDKNFVPKVVIDKAEGDQIVIEKGFDPGLIKLTGNVTGDPPFKGILRHKGWQVKKVELPTLSGVNPKVIAPAEVEIL